MPHYVITAVVLDRPGIVDELAGALHSAGANIADARMINLRGQFAILLLAEGPAEADLARAAGDAGARAGLSLTVTPQGADAHRRAASGGAPYRLHASAMDQPGIVHRITHLLHERGVNIEELQTRLRPGSVSGTPLFTMDLRLSAPAEVSVPELGAALESLGDSLNCDVTLEPG